MPAATANQRSPVSGVVGTLALGVFGFALGSLILSVMLPEPQPQVARPAPLPGAEAAAAAADAPPADWPPLFGTAPEVVAEAPPPPPPVRTDAYQLRGLMAAEGGGWGILVDLSGEVLVRVGDTLSDGAVVTAIDRSGITLRRDGVDLQVAFEDSPATELATELATDLPSGVSAAEPAATAPDAPPTAASLPTERVELSLNGISGGDFRRAIARAGGITEAQTEDGAAVLEVLFVRPGQLYDRIGLRAGDRVLSINGIAATDNRALQSAAGELLSAGAYTIELIRNGQRQAIAITMDQDD